MLIFKVPNTRDMMYFSKWKKNVELNPVCEKTFQN